MQHSDIGETIFYVDDTSDLPIWVQLRNRIAYLIRTGHFAPGQQIPSVRSISASAKINYTTVTKAYKDLEQSGTIVSVRGRGMYVQKSSTPKQESAESNVDIIVEDCVRQYRAIGMTFAEARLRMKNIACKLEEEAQSAAEEKLEYYDV